MYVLIGNAAVRPRPKHLCLTGPVNGSGNDFRAGTLYSGQNGRSYTNSDLDNLVKYWAEFN